MIRARTGRPLETGEVRPIKEGKPLMGGEIVTLKPREGAPQVCDVEVTYKPAPKAEARKLGPGPAQVATDEYRASYDRTFTSRSN